MSYLRDVYLSGTRARANAAAPHGPQVPRHRDGIRPRTAAGRGGTAGDNDRYGRNEVTGSTQMSKPGSIRVSAEGLLPNRHQATQVAAAAKLGAGDKPVTRRPVVTSHNPRAELPGPSGRSRRGLAPVRWPSPPERHGYARGAPRRDRPARAAACSACTAAAEGLSYPGSSEAPGGSQASRTGDAQGGTAAGA